MEGGDANEPGDAGGSPGKSSLFFLTALLALESVRPERGPHGRQSTLSLEVSGALPTVRENPGERFVLTTGRTHNRIRSPR